MIGCLKQINKKGAQTDHRKGTAKDGKRLDFA